MIPEKEMDSIRQKLLEQVDALPEEQGGNLREKISSMNDEELSEFLAESKSSGKCIFCEIISGSIETVKLYETKNILAILDINPASLGHTIVMPKEHAALSIHVSTESWWEIFYFTKIVSPILLSLTKAEGVSTYFNQGIEQNIPHFFVNIVPRHHQDNISFNLPRQPAKKEALSKLAASISSEIKKQLAGSQKPVQKQVRGEQKNASEESKHEEKKSGFALFKSRGLRIP